MNILPTTFLYNETTTKHDILMNTNSVLTGAKIRTSDITILKDEETVLFQIRFSGSIKLNYLSKMNLDKLDVNIGQKDKGVMVTFMYDIVTCEIN